MAAENMVISVLGINGILLKANIPQPNLLFSAERCSKSMTATLNIHTRQCLKPVAFSKRAGERKGSKMKCAWWYLYFSYDKMHFPAREGEESISCKVAVSFV